MTASGGKQVATGMNKQKQATLVNVKNQAISLSSSSHQRNPQRAISTGHGFRNTKAREQQKLMNTNNSSNLVSMGGQSKQIVNHIQTLVRNRNPAATSAAVSSNPYFN